MIMSDYEIMYLCIKKKIHFIVIRLLLLLIIQEYLINQKSLVALTNALKKERKQELSCVVIFRIKFVDRFFFLEIRRFFEISN